MDEDRRIEYMDRYGIDVEVLSFPLPLWDTIQEKSSLIRAMKLINDSIAEIVEKRRRRMVGVAFLPFLEDEALDELDRAINQLGMKGCIIFSNVRGRPLDAPEFMPFYERMRKYDLPILIHPTGAMYYNWMSDYRLASMLGWPFDTSLAMARLVFGGVLDRYPKLKVVTHHLGGMVPYFAERIRGFHDEAIMHSDIYGSHLFPNYNKMRKKNQLDYFKLFYGDTVVNGNLSALKCGYDFFGPDRVVFATDYPFGPMRGELWTKEIIRSVREIRISENDRKKIFEENARKLLRMR